MLRAGRRSTCNRKPEFLHHDSISGDAEKIPGSSAVFIVEYLFVSRLAKPSVYARHGSLRLVCSGDRHILWPCLQAVSGSRLVLVTEAQQPEQHVRPD